MYMKTNKVIPKILNPFFTLVQQPDSFEYICSLGSVNLNFLIVLQFFQLIHFSQDIRKLVSYILI